MAHLYDDLLRSHLNVFNTILDTHLVQCFSVLWLFTLWLTLAFVCFCAIVFIPAGQLIAARLL